MQPELPQPQSIAVKVDVSQLIDDFKWLQAQLFKRFPQGVGERISNLDGFLSRIGDEVIQLENSSASNAGCLVIRFGLRRRAELLSTAIAALEGDIAQVNRLHGVLQ
jgi:hypothetical protein